MRNVLMVAVVAALAMPGVGYAQQRPLQTEDPETVGSNRVLLEGGVEFDKDQTNTANGVEGDITHIGTFGVSVGVSPHAEVQVDGGVLQRLRVTDRMLGGPLVPFVLLRAGDESTGFADLVVATKIRFTSETEARPALGIRFGTKLPTADSTKGIGIGTTDFFASFLVAKTVQSVRTVGNVGLVMLGNPEQSRDPAKAMSFGFSVARAVTDAFEFVGELNGRLSPFEEIVPRGLESRAALRFAGRYTYSMLRLDAGVILGLTSRDPTFGISAGATYVITR